MSGAAGSPDIASKPAKEILSDVAAAIGDLRSYRLEGSQLDKEGRTRLVGDVKASGSMRVRVANGCARAQMVVVGSATYMKANREFWLAQDSSSSSYLDLSKISGA